MFSSNNSENPLSYTNETLFKQSFTFDQNPNSRQEDLPFFLHFPSPFLDENELLLGQTMPQQQLMTNPGGEDDEVTPNKHLGEASLQILQPNSFGDSWISTRHQETQNQICEKKGQQKRSGKHRHSKIYTAQGLRDRRMRLSVQIARKFFDLQDMLGFDKASKTIEWLFTMSKEAINEINTQIPQTNIGCSSEVKSESPMSECEAASGVEEPINVEERKRISAAKVETLVSVQSSTKLRKGAYYRLAKESRDKARARARERTREKTRLGESKLCVEAMSHELNHLGSSWNSLETGEESGTQGHNKNPFYNKLLLAHELEERAGSDQNQMQQLVGGASEYIVGDSMVITDNWSPSSTFGYQCNSGILNENQFSEFQLGKSWEAYDNINLC